MMDGLPALKEPADLPIVEVAAQAVTRRASVVDRRFYLLDIDGNPVVDWDACEEFQYMNQTIVAQYPLEQGNFQSYNKVGTPADIRFIATVQDPQKRAQFIKNCDDRLKATDTFSIVTPNTVYKNFTLVALNYAQTAVKGFAMIGMEMTFHEMRENQSSRFERVAQPEASDAVNNGQVSAVEVQ